MEAFFLPNMDYWTYGNDWTGSLSSACFYIKPEDEQFHASIWTGPNCKELSEPEATALFPLSEEGLSQLKAWLKQQAAEINGRGTEIFRIDW